MCLYSVNGLLGKFPVQLVILCVGISVSEVVIFSLHAAAHSSGRLPSEFVAGGPRVMAGAIAIVVAKAANWAEAVVFTELKIVLNVLSGNSSAGSIWAFHFIVVAIWV